ncbi:hypothetical protein GCM10011491_13290 [Brucella endophytica]|uniref:Sugar ABC transporter ATP-binding protein n=1 Tax=Brucella endophytica TaxID=1963359 RepID=A0A916S8I2_9HYPH|nr:hypothetical protein GCM10011491_13290 [Brucella endophytica]
MNLKPWPEQGEATTMRGSPGMDAMRKRISIRPGDRRRLLPDLDKLHLFDAATAERLAG